MSENSTSYGKDLGDLRLLESLLPELAAVPGISRVRVSYLQPAEVRPGLVEVLAGTPGVARYFDLSFQHASGPVLRAMRRFGDRERFVRLTEQIRSLAPDAGIRSNFIVGFPGETDADVAELQAFLEEARLDAIGVFGYSDEDGTEAASLPGQLPEAEIAGRVEELASGWAWMRQRAELAEAGHPGWFVRPTRRHDGLGLEAVRQSDGAALIGAADEVEAEIARLEGAADGAP